MTRELSDALFRFATVIGCPVAWTEGLIVSSPENTCGEAGNGVWRRYGRAGGWTPSGPASPPRGPSVHRFILPGRGTVHLRVRDDAGWASKPLCAGTPSEQAAYLNHLSLVACHLDHLRTCSAADIRSAS